MLAGLSRQVMYGYYGLGFDRALAQAQSIQLAEAGADAASYKETFSATVQKGQQAPRRLFGLRGLEDVSRKELSRALFPSFVFLFLFWESERSNRKTSNERVQGDMS